MMGTTLDRLSAGIRPYVVLTLLCLAAFLPGLAAVPPLDRDESRFIQATRQMLETGDFIRIQFQNEMRAKKPVGAYWLQAASVTAFSHLRSSALWPYRLPAALSAWAAVLMTFAFGRSLVGARAALLGAGMLAGAVILVSEAHQAKTDAILLACAVAAQGVLMRFYVAARAREAAQAHGGVTPPMPGLAEAALFWVAQGAAILVKGPIVPAITLLTLAALAVADRSLRWAVALRPLTGALIAAAIAGPWFAAVSNATHGAFVGEAVRGDLLSKITGAQESHGGPPGLYLALFAATFWPGSLLAWPALTRVWGERRRPVFRFLLAWLVPAWVMFELVPTKLPHYVLPMFPAIALLTGAMVAGNAEVFRGRAARWYAAAWTLVGLALAAAVVVLPLRFGSGLDLATLPAALGIVLATLLPATLAWRGQTVPAALALALTAAATYPAVFSEVLPHLDRLWVSRAIAETADSLGVTEPIAAAGFSEPSLVVLMGTRTLLGSGGAAAQHLAAHPRSLAAVADPEQAAFLAAAAAGGVSVQAVGRVEGFNYSRGKPVELTLYTRGAP